jgi:Protein kinase domain
MLEALEFLHSKSCMIVHRDVSPENILYNVYDHFVLAGFSLARVAPATGGDSFERRTYRYLAPEAYQNLEETKAVDIWALGTLCLDILQLLPRFDIGPDHPISNQPKWFHNVCVLGKYPGELELKRMLMKNASDRASASEMLESVRSSSMGQIKRFRASVDLLYFIFRDDPSYYHLTSKELREYSASYFLNPEIRPRPPPLPLVGQSLEGPEGRVGHPVSITRPEGAAEVAAWRRALYDTLRAGMGPRSLSEALERHSLPEPGRLPESSDLLAMSHPGGSMEAAESSEAGRNRPIPEELGPSTSRRSPARSRPTGAGGREAGSSRSGTTSQGATGTGETAPPSTSTATSSLDPRSAKEKRLAPKGESRTQGSPEAHGTSSTQPSQSRGQSPRPPARSSEARTDKPPDTEITKQSLRLPPPPDTSSELEKSRLEQPTSQRPPQPQSRESSPRKLPGAHARQEQQRKGKSIQPSAPSSEQSQKRGASLRRTKDSPEPSKTGDAKASKEQAQVQSGAGSSSHAEVPTQPKVPTETPASRGKSVKRRSRR